MSTRNRTCRSALCAVLLLWTIVSAEPPPPEPPPFEKPKPPPAQVSSSEGTKPLPGPPGVMQKRQEKKNPPLPPVLLTKIRTADAEDWASTPDDLKGLLEWMSREMNVNFTSNIKSFPEISTRLGDNPILYRCGYKPFELLPQEITRLREYLLHGGTVIFSALVGHPQFYHSAVRVAQQILPESPLYRLRLDHPIFHAYYNINKVAYNARMKRDGVAKDDYPYLEGIDIENRTALIISRSDFSMGWEQNKHDSWGYTDNDARKIGGNILAYATAMEDAGRSVGKSILLADADKKNVSKFRVGQVIHDGPWKTRVAAFPMLLNAFHLLTGAPVSFELHDVRLNDDAIFQMPFLYLTGTTDFTLNESERTNLRRFLVNGGTLFIEASDGRQTFDQAVRAELAKVFPENLLQRLPPDHRLFGEPKKLTTIKARPALAARHGNTTELPPELYGIELNGTLAVIYSPHDLSAGWERAIAPYAVGYEAADSTVLGVNVLFHVVAR